MRVGILATVLCCAIILPLNLTAPCEPDVVGESVCAEIANLTDFGRTTLANIPPMDFLEEAEAVNEGSVQDDGEVTIQYVGDVLSAYFRSAPGVTSRLFAVVIVAWCIYIYACGE